jgi:hypothetical protein
VWNIVVVVLMAALIGVQLWGLFVREVGWTVFLSALLCGVAAWSVRSMTSPEKPLVKSLLSLAVVMLFLGLLAEPLEGGIKKDPATIGYFFVTGAMATFVLIAALVLELRFGIRFRFLEASGANPMFAYTASGYLIQPLAVLTGLSVYIERMAALTPWCGFLRGVLFALLVMAITYPFTRKNYFWKS